MIQRDLPAVCSPYSYTHFKLRHATVPPGPVWKEVKKPMQSSCWLICRCLTLRLQLCQENQPTDETRRIHFPSLQSSEQLTFSANKKGTLIYWLELEELAGERDVRTVLHGLLIHVWVKAEAVESVDGWHPKNIETSLVHSLYWNIFMW